jgi:hypothetical protein
LKIRELDFLRTGVKSGKRIHALPVNNPRRSTGTMLRLHKSNQTTHIGFISTTTGRVIAAELVMVSM